MLFLTWVGQGVQVPAEDKGDGVAVVRAWEGQLVLAGGVLHKLLQLPHEHHGLHHLDVTELGVPVDVCCGHQQQLPGQRLRWHGAWEESKGKWLDLNSSVTYPEDCIFHHPAVKGGYVIKIPVEFPFVIVRLSMRAQSSPLKGKVWKMFYSNRLKTGIIQRVRCLREAKLNIILLKKWKQCVWQCECVCVCWILWEFRPNRTPDVSMTKLLKWQG